ncbi:hypothetical protein HFP89_03980 [Wenzhouxiangella sp. XN79A]|uniref:hypothetical protein n=1 Tax=Wenzhouxiangella sp. XN79A TaxID=2724193 RepID=UPI00144AB50B|nr:hypothetical protein [Wenzhouxiangella sp. XN79A]NKI34318.1 hypothetical protein [Wenzhouxiangella sp. XN79A]
MAEVRLHLDLERASGVLAGIVAALAQQGLELKTQKLTRASEGRGGTLDIRAEGDPDDIETLAERMATARGVGRVVAIELDGEPVFADGAVIVPAVEAPPADDVESELDAFLEPEPAPVATPAPPPDPDAPLQPELEPEPARRPAAPAPPGDDELGPLLHPGDPEDAGLAADEKEAGNAVGRKPLEPAPGDDDPTTEADAGSGWGDEELDNWADELDEAERDAALAADETATDQPEPEAPDATFEREHEPPSEPSRPDTVANDPDRTAATLRRRRRRRR